MCDIKEHKLAQRLEKDLSATLKPVLTVGVGSLGGGSSVVSKEKGAMPSVEPVSGDTGSSVRKLTLLSLPKFRWCI